MSAPRRTRSKTTHAPRAAAAAESTAIEVPHVTLDELVARVQRPAQVRRLLIVAERFERSISACISADPSAEVVLDRSTALGVVATLGVLRLLFVQKRGERAPAAARP